MPLRKSTGLRDKFMGIKTNLITNGTFDTDTTGWSAADATLSAAAGGSGSTTGMQIENSSAASGSAYQNIDTVAGRIYLLTLKGKIGTSDGYGVMIGTPADDDSILPLMTFADATLTDRSFAFVAEDSSTRITLVNTSSDSGETVLFDDVVVDEILDGFVEIMRNCKINIYTGSQPASANDAATGTLLVTITKGGDGSTGLTWEPASGNGVASKPSGDVWQGTAVASGTAGWFRCYAEGDDPSSSSATAARFDGAISTSGAQINMTSTSVASGSVQTIASFTYTDPAS